MSGGGRCAAVFCGTSRPPAPYPGDGHRTPAAAGTGGGATGRALSQRWMGCCGHADRLLSLLGRSPPSICLVVRPSRCYAAAGVSCEVADLRSLSAHQPRVAGSGGWVSRRRPVTDGPTGAVHSPALSRSAPRVGCPLAPSAFRGGIAEPAWTLDSVGPVVGLRTQPVLWRDSGLSRSCDGTPDSAGPVAGLRTLPVLWRDSGLCRSCDGTPDSAGPVAGLRTLPVL